MLESIKTALWFLQPKIIPAAMWLSSWIDIKAKKTNKYSQCDILISRNYFGNTVSQNMQKFEGTYGIDMTSGTAFAQYSEFGNVKNVVVRT